MPTYTINFVANINNDSLQLGDYAYSVIPSPTGGFNQSSQTPVLLGVVVDITNNSIDVNNDNVGVATQPTNGSFIMFAKDSRINLSGLVGYYAEVKIKNNSTEKAELYSVASEITPSSK